MDKEPFLRDTLEAVTREVSVRKEKEAPFLALIAMHRPAITIPKSVHKEPQTRAMKRISV